MSKYERNDWRAGLLVFAVALLIIYCAIDLWADHKDMHHIRDLQRRIAVLEQTR